jgi:hypothetical protein
LNNVVFTRCSTGTYRQKKLAKTFPIINRTVNQAVQYQFSIINVHIILIIINSMTKIQFFADLQLPHYIIFSKHPSLSPQVHDFGSGVFLFGEYEVGGFSLYFVVKSRYIDGIALSVF